jgi:hypothetical protein
MQVIQNPMIKRPTAAEVLAAERGMKGERLELFQEAFDVLRDEKRAKGDPGIEWRLENLGYLYRGFERVSRESGNERRRPAGTLRVRLKEVSGTDVFDLGLASVNVVTTAGVNYVIDAIQSLATISNLKWHASGTNNTAENVSNTALGSETGSRVSGTQAEGASANIYKTVATVSYGSSLSIVEHGLFSASTTGTLFDRSVFTAIAVDTSTSIEFTYEWTLNAGG